MRVGSTPTEEMHLMMAEMTNVITVDRRGIVIIMARDMNIVVHTMPDTRPPSSEKHTNTHTVYTPGYFLVV